MQNFPDLSPVALSKILNEDTLKHLGNTLNWDDPATSQNLHRYAAFFSETKLRSYRRIETRVRELVESSEELNRHSSHKEREQFVSELLVEHYQQAIETLIEEVSLLTSLAAMLNIRVEFFKRGINPFPSQEEEIKKSSLH